VPAALAAVLDLSPMSRRWRKRSRDVAGWLQQFRDYANADPPHPVGGVTSAWHSSPAGPCRFERSPRLARRVVFKPLRRDCHGGRRTLFPNGGKNRSRFPYALGTRRAGQPNAQHDGSADRDSPPITATARRGERGDRAPRRCPLAYRRSRTYAALPSRLRYVRSARLDHGRCGTPLCITSHRRRRLST